MCLRVCACMMCCVHPAVCVARRVYLSMEGRRPKAGSAIARWPVCAVLLLLSWPPTCWAGGTGHDGPEDEGFGPSTWLSRINEGSRLENGGYTSAAHVAAEQKLRSHNQVHNSAATVAKVGNKVAITSASTSVISSVVVHESSGTNAKKLLGAVISLAGTAAAASLSGNNIVITSASTGTKSKVSIDAGSGAKAKALLGSGSSKAGAAATGAVVRILFCFLLLCRRVHTCGV